MSNMISAGATADLITVSLKLKYFILYGRRFSG